MEPQAPPFALDHVGLRVVDLLQEIARWRALGMDVSDPRDGLAIVQLAQGVRLALLGPGARDPNHVALRTSAPAPFEAWAQAEHVRIVEKPGGERRFMARGGPGLALEIIGPPPEP